MKIDNQRIKEKENIVTIVMFLKSFTLFTQCEDQ